MPLLGYKSLERPRWRSTFQTHATGRIRRVGFFMATPETVDEALEQAALGPKRVRTGEFDVEGHSLADLIKAKKELAATDATAAASPHRGMRFSRMIPPGGGG